MSGFRGWPASAIEFYEGLEVDNSRAYWEANKRTYEQAVRRPMEELLAELAPEFGPGKIFRPQRDVRFSSDKSPYKTAIAATIGRGYVQLSAEGLAAGAGLYAPAPDQLERFRSAVADDETGEALVAIVATLRAKHLTITASEVLKTAPRGYPKDHPRIELLRHKGLVSWKGWPAGSWLGRASAKARVVEFLRASRPLVDWLETHVVPSLATTER